MKLSTVLERMPYWYEARRSFYLGGPIGRGKTSVIERAPEVIGKRLNLNLGIVVINGGLLTPIDTLGYGVPRHSVTPEGKQYTEMVFSAPFFWRTREGKRLEEYDGGVIFIDEADKADTDVKKNLGEGALSGRFGPHTLPPGWVVWMAGNRQKDRSGSTKELDHLINRRNQLNIEDDLESLMDWMLHNGCLPVTLAFTKNNSHIVFEEQPKEQRPWCTPRSLVMQDKYLQVLAKHNNDELPTDPSTIEEVAGGIGDGAAQQFFSFVKLQREMPPYEKIVANPDKVKVPDKPDAQMLVCYTLAHRVTADDISPVIKYVERMPKEFSVTFAVAAAARNSKLILAPAFNKWALENSSLMTSLIH